MIVVAVAGVSRVAVAIFVVDVVVLVVVVVVVVAFVVNAAHFLASQVFLLRSAFSQHHSKPDE